MMMKTFSAFSAAALLVATPIAAQPGNLPFGNPLGDTQIEIPAEPAPNPFADRDAALARAQALSAWRSRQAALLESARPMPGASGGASRYVDYGRIGAQQQSAQGADTLRPQRGPEPFARGITGVMAGGIRPVWDRR